MQVLIVEDEAPAFRRLQKILEEINPQIEIVEVLDSVDDSVQWFANHTHPDLIFMDIQLSDGLSFEIFESVQINRPVIFTTAFDEYMLRAFKVNSIDYLLKPIKKDELEASIAKFQQLKSTFSGAMPDLNQLISTIRLDDKMFKTRFLVKKGEELLSVRTEDIAYFQTRHGVVHMITNGGKSHLMDFTLDELTHQLDPNQFYRANRQFIIHFPAIRKVHKFHKGKLLIELLQPCNEQITVSAEKATDFKEWLGDWSVRPYLNLSRHSGVKAYAIGDDYVDVAFVSGDSYRYSYKVPGREHVENMKYLAREGMGLSTDISKVVKQNYARKL